VELDKDNADYYFWLGVTNGELGDSKAERSNYKQALRIRKRHLQANLYMGHLQLKANEFRQAIKSYDLVLDQMPTNAAALYNRALTLDIEGDGYSGQEGLVGISEMVPCRTSRSPGD
jgi:lipoprotein NlpI